MEQLILHLFGDYILQSDWMANNKTTKSFACLCHVVTYTLLFLLLTDSFLALLVIGVSHFVIDRWRLAKYVIYAKNFFAPSAVLLYDEHENCDYCCPKIVEKYRWENCKATGYPSETPPFLAVWLMIIADNTLHLAINYLALKYL